MIAIEQNGLLPYSQEAEREDDGGSKCLPQGIPPVTPLLPMLLKAPLTPTGVACWQLSLQYIGTRQAFKTQYIALRPAFTGMCLHYKKSAFTSSVRILKAVTGPYCSKA